MSWNYCIGDSTSGEPDAALSEIEEIIDDLSFLANTENRLQILQLLGESDRSPTELQRRLDIPRTTLRRNVVELEERRLIETDPTEDEIRLLPAGEIIVDASRSFLSHVNTATDVAKFLEHIDESLPIPTDAFLDCEIILCDDRDPYAPVYRFLEICRSSDYVRGVFPSVNPLYVEQFADELSIEIGLYGTKETFRSLHPEHASTLRQLRDSEYVQLFVVDEVTPYGVCLASDHVVVEAYDENLLTNAVLVADATQGPVADWATETVRSFCERSTPIDGATIVA